MPRIVVIGSLNMDLVATAPRIPVPGETIIGRSYFTQPGGKGANQAYAAARLGGDVAMIGRVGDDSFGLQMRENLSVAGCDVTDVSTNPGPSGVALIFVAANGENSIIVVPGANDKLDADDVTPKIETAQIVLLQLETPLSTVLAAARHVRQQNATVILDPAPAPAARLPEELCRAVDVLTPNESEAAILTGSPPGRLTPETAANIAKKLQQLGPQAVIVKLGEQGCILVHAGNTMYIPAPPVDAIDTTAAGDVFNGALAVALSERSTLPDACAFAVQAAALSVTRRGAQTSVPSRLDVDAFAKLAASSLLELQSGLE